MSLQLEQLLNHVYGLRPNHSSSLPASMLQDQLELYSVIQSLLSVYK